MIGGFLGAGKTTLLNRWLRDSGGQRLAVLVNDFGALNIDTELIAANTGKTIALSNGCVCCKIGDDLSMALVTVLDTADNFDAVVIEASGVADPWRVAQMGRADPGLVLDGGVVLVDTSVALAQSRDPLLADTLERQLRAADLIVLNKTDLSSAAERAALRSWVVSVAGHVAQFETIDAVVPLALLSGLAMPPAGTADVAPAPGHKGHRHRYGHAHGHDHAQGHHDPGHGAVFDTWSCQPSHCFFPEALRSWLRQVPPGVLRLKGVLRTLDAGVAGWAEIQFAGHHGALRAAMAPAAGPAVVAIGLCGQLPVAALAAWFEDGASCAAAP